MQAAKRVECSSSIAGGEAEQIVDDHVNRSADRIAGKVGVIHGFGKNALSGESGVAVHEQRKIFFAAAFAGAILLGAGAADGDGIDGFQMAGIRNQMDVNFVAAARDVFAGRAHVILHVAGAENAARVDIFKSGKDFFGGTLGHVRDHVQAAAMAHAHDQFASAQTRAGVEKLVHQRNQRGDAFQRKALAAEIALLHDLLEDVGADEQIKNARFLVLDLRRLRFHALVNPAAALGRVDVIDLDADGGGVDGAGFAGVLACRSAIREWGADGGSREDRDRLRDIPTGGRR